MIADGLEKNGLSKRQPLIGLLVLVLMIGWGEYLHIIDGNLPVYLVAGLMIGYVLTRSRFGFAGGVKRTFYRGEGSLATAIIILLAVTAIVNVGIQWFAASKGALPAWKITNPGQSIIPGTQNVRIGNISVMLGGFLFGMGMLMAGGCASGTLSDFGEGEGHAWMAFPFFVLFAAPGQYIGYQLDNTAIGKVGINAWLPQYVGYGGAIALTLGMMLILYVILKRYENRKKRQGVYLDPKSDWESFEKPLQDDPEEPFKLWSWKTYHRFFVQRWTFVTGSVGIAVASVFILTTTGKAWGVTTPFVSLDQKFLGLFGMKFTSPAFDETATAMQHSLLVDGGTIRNIGIVVGALIAFLLAGRFSMKFKMTLRDFGGYEVGGALMGLGSRMARGCNIGALYSSITNFSVHGYIFMAFLILGGAVAIKLFAGKIALCPTYKVSRKPLFSTSSN
ncbi:YeeE/YedE family protein [Lentilactobacillus parafarraginis]|uniref:Membrane protein n=1 Tax=Lentilactobacillus parafarraginis DSM 18390 = JCM 14109 TaxID=1423786 RepID=A0A0R1Z0G4_9LACO|nr:YeeE/YedE family protein [Lentilactobacillus parafarraginis]KRM44524.1 membrane protein [Lentilactobacillus parafarraginis DSM 18390 = JCM 14109]